MSSAFSSEAVRYHINQYRQVHFARPVAYDSGLANLAKDRATKLGQQINISLTSSTPNGNQSVFVIKSNDGKTSTEMIKSSIDAWYSQVTKFDFGSSKHITAKTVEAWKAADFARVVWKATRRIGAGISVKEGGDTAVVVMMFDPPGLGLIQDVRTNVRSATVDLFSALDDYYKKEESDARFLSIGSIDNVEEGITSNVKEEVTATIGSEINDLQTEVRSFYVRKADLQNRIEEELEGYATEAFVFDRIQELDPRFETIDSNILHLDEKLDTTESNLQADISSNESALGSLKTDLNNNYFDKSESLELFAKDASFQKLKGDVYGKYLDSEQLEKQFTSRLRLKAFSNDVTEQFEMSESNTNSELAKIKDDIEKLMHIVGEFCNGD